MPALNFQSVKFSETTEEFHQSVCKNVNTNLSQLEKDVQVLKEWLKTQHHLPQCSSDNMLKAFILGSKNSLEKAKVKIENYYTARAEMPEIFSDRDPTNEKIIQDAEAIHAFRLPQLTPDGCVVIMLSFRTEDGKRFDPDTFSKRVLMCGDIQINRPEFVKGVYYIMDGTHLSMSHVMKFSPRFIRQLLHCAQEVFPFSIKGIIYFNSPTYIELVLALLKPFLKSKLFQRVHVYTEGVEALENYFPKSILPKDYGGDEECTSDELNESWMKCLQDNRDWFMNEGEQKAVINKNKVESGQRRGEFEGMQGSFKTLCID